MATVTGDVRTWSDGIPHVGLYSYQVTALYDGAIEKPTFNEVTQLVTSVKLADPNLLPREFALEQNYPNPFNPRRG